VKPYYFLFSLLFQVCFLAATLNQPGPAETSQRQPAEHTPLLSPAAGRANTTALSNSQQYCTLQQSTETTGRSPATSKFWSQQLPPAASPLQPLHFPSGNAASSLQLLKFPSGITASPLQLPALLPAYSPASYSPSNCHLQQPTTAPCSCQLRQQPFSFLQLRQFQLSLRLRQVSCPEQACHFEAAQQPNHTR